MSIETTIIKPGKLFYHKLTGPFSTREIYTAMSRFWIENDQLADVVDSIWDLTETIFLDISFVEIDSLGAEVAEFLHNAKLGKSIILINNAPEKHLISYLIGIISPYSDREFIIFHDLQQSYNYIGYQPKSNNS